MGFSNIYSIQLLLIAPVFLEIERFDKGFNAIFSIINNGRMHNTLIYYENMDIGGCMLECIRFLSCVTFNYHFERKICELTDDNFDMDVADVDALGWFNYGTAPKVDGAFAEWIAIDKCSAECGSEGRQTQIRSCTNPAPSNGGADCIGERTRIVTCIVDCPIIKTVACSRKMLTLSCTNGKTIKIVKASYGRSDTTTCPYSNTGAMKKTDCHDATSQRVMENTCNGKEACSMGASSKHFGGVDPCVGTYKYLSVTHICQ